MYMSSLDAGRLRGKGRIKPGAYVRKRRELSTLFKPEVALFANTAARIATTAKGLTHKPRMPSIPYAEPRHATEARPFRPTPELRIVTDKVPVRKRPSLWETFFPTKAAPRAVEARRQALVAPTTGRRAPTEITVDVIKGTKKLITYTFYGETEAEARALEKKQAVMDPLFRGATQQGRYGSTTLGVKRSSKRRGWWS